MLYYLDTVIVIYAVEGILAVIVVLVLPKLQLETADENQIFDIGCDAWDFEQK